MNRHELLTTHWRNRKTGKIDKVTPYTMKVSRDKGTTFIKEGKSYNEDGSLKDPTEAIKLAEERAKVAQAEFEKLKALANKPEEAKDEQRSPAIDSGKLRGGRKK